MADLVLGRLRDVMAAHYDLLPCIPGRVQRAVNREIRRDLVRAARPQAEAHVAHARVEQGSFVARMGMPWVPELRAEELHHMEQTPTTAAARYQGIGDALAARVTNGFIKVGYDL
jgi:hypothetical protein